MMNYIWAVLIIFSFVSAAFAGNMQELSSAIISSGADAVNLCIRLLGMLCLWNGLMNIAEKSGLTEKIGKALSPVLKLIFRDSKKQPGTLNAISMNITANLLGLGNAATPLGLEAMRRLQEQNGNSHIASDDMIKFVVINSAALKIIPTNVAVIRQSYGAENPMDIMPAVWISSIAALGVGITVAELCRRQKSDIGVANSKPKHSYKNPVRDVKRNGKA